MSHPHPAQSPQPPARHSERNLLRRLRHTVAVPEWEPDLGIEPPPWMVEGVRVLHSTFGLGTIGQVGTYKDVPTVWIDFDNGQTKALALEFGLPHLAPQSAAKEPERLRLFGRTRR